MPLKICYKAVAEESKSRAAAEVSAKYNDKLDDKILCRVSLDGSWQKGGQSSLNGLATAISNGKCIDSETFSKFCKGCSSWSNVSKESQAYQCWYAEHKCNANHEKSSGAMEAAGAVAIFNRSVMKYNLIYNEYLGDGDTTSFKEVLDSHPYDEFGVEPQKLECVGHIQKRLGTRLRTLIKTHKAEKNLVYLAKAG